MLVAGFRTDIFKASISAVLTAILLGAAIYVFTLQIGVQVPRPVGRVEAYTERGGFGPYIVGGVYFYNENISIFAYVKDASDNSIADASVTFEIRGPPNSNITLLETTKTNSSGVAIANITAPYIIGRPETVSGIWNVVATTEIADTQIVDSLAFEVESPPSPFVDVYTDRGGNGLNKPSQAYSPGERVQLYAEVSNGTGPIANALVTFAASGPTNETVPFLTSAWSNASGIATARPFTIGVGEQSIGTWQVILTVKIDDQVFMDALTFDCLSAT